MKECIWEYRPGTDDSHFAFTPCSPGFNFLSKIGKEKPSVGVADIYNGRICPICGKIIKMSYKVIKEV